MSELNYVSTSDFREEVLTAATPVLVDFTAAWCHPCKLVDPIVTQLADEWQGKAKVVKCDADQNPDILAQYGILGIPTLILFVGGKVQERTTGFQSKEKLNTKFGAHLK